MWKRLGELNKEFKNIKKFKKDSKKKGTPYLRCKYFFFNNKFVVKYI